MFEKVNPEHPDKVADRIAGAIVDYAYTLNDNPKVAVEVLIGHGKCNVIAETSEHIAYDVVEGIVKRISKREMAIEFHEFRQDGILAKNQSGAIRCGDNGIFRGCPVTAEQQRLADIAADIYNTCGTDGKYILDGTKLIVCQSCCNDNQIRAMVPNVHKLNPLGSWTGGTDVDTGATNRKLGSDMGDAVTGGGLHGKDLSKADVSVNVYAFLKAQREGHPVTFSCAIGDETIDGRPYAEIVAMAAGFIHAVGGFEKFAEWGLIAPHQYLMR